MGKVLKEAVLGIVIVGVCWVPVVLVAVCIAVLMGENL